MTTANLIYIGRFPLIDLVENNRNAERASVLLGTRAESSSLQIVSVLLEDGGDGRVDTDDFGTQDTFTYDLGAGSVTQKTDATVLAVVRVFDPSGTASDITVTVIQAQNGDLFLADRPGQGSLDDREIESVEILSVSNSLGRGWSADQSVEGSTIVSPPEEPDGTVDGEATGETMVLGYDDGNPPTDQGGDRITTGNDVIFGNGGDDIIDGDAGNDVIYGDGGPAQSDEPAGPPGNDTIFGSAGNDTIFGQEGDDILRGEAGDDDIFGGDGDDEIDGGSGSDGLDGGAGADTIRLGRSDDDDPASPVDGDRDVASGGDDADTFLEVGVDDVVDGGAGGNDLDTLDLRGSAPAGGSLSVNTTGADSDGNGFRGTVAYFDGGRNLVGTSTFFNIETVVPCFTPGTLIATVRGEVRVEDLTVGDRVITRDNGIQPVRWTGSRRMTRADLDRAPHLRPVRVLRGALGDGLPERDMMVSPNHRFLVASDRTALYFEESEVLVAAKHLTALAGVDVARVEETVFVHFMFDQHEVVLSDGAWTESFQPGAQTLDAMGHAQREELFELFPELRSSEGVEAYCSARKSLRKHEARLLVLQ